MFSLALLISLSKLCSDKYTQRDLEQIPLVYQHESKQTICDYYIAVHHLRVVIDS